MRKNLTSRMRRIVGFSAKQTEPKMNSQIPASACFSRRRHAADDELEGRQKIDGRVPDFVERIDTLMLGRAVASLRMKQLHAAISPRCDLR